MKKPFVIILILKIIFAVGACGSIYSQKEAESGPRQRPAPKHTGRTW